MQNRRDFFKTVAGAAAGAYVAAIIGERAFEDLDGPVRRVPGAQIPVPFAPQLEAAALPDARRVREACLDLLDY